MSYIVAHCRKVQTAVGARNVAAHNCREGVYDQAGRPLGKLPDYLINPDRAHLNDGDRCGGLAVLARRSERIAAAGLTRKPQKNAAALVEITVSASPDWSGDWKTYFSDAKEYLNVRFGRENLVHWATHYDEKTPHLHLLYVPIVKNRYTSSEFLGGRAGLRDLQAQMYEKVGKYHGLERGIEGSLARHTDQTQWAAKKRPLEAAIEPPKRRIFESGKKYAERQKAMLQPVVALAAEAARLKKERNHYQAEKAQAVKQQQIHDTKILRHLEAERDQAAARAVAAEKSLANWRGFSPADLRARADEFDRVGAKNAHEYIKKHENQQKGQERD